MHQEAALWYAEASYRKLLFVALVEILDIIIAYSEWKCPINIFVI